jgi:hypothetical protein
VYILALKQLMLYFSSHPFHKFSLSLVLSGSLGLLFIYFILFCFYFLRFPFFFLFLVFLASLIY